MRPRNWKIVGYLFVVLTVLFSLAALSNIMNLNSNDGAESFGAIIGSLILPIASGWFARRCFRKAREKV